MEGVIEQAVRRKSAEIQRTNTRKVVALLEKDHDLHNLYKIFGWEGATEYRKTISRYADLCELSKERRLNDVEQGELQVKRLSLYPEFGDEGTVHIVSLWIATKPARQARNS